MSYKKVGGIHFVKVWRFGFNFYVSRSKRERVEEATNVAFSRLERVLQRPAVRSRIVPNGGRIFN